jgi:hypothetical protein
VWNGSALHAVLLFCRALLLHICLLNPLSAIAASPGPPSLAHVPLKVSLSCCFQPDLCLSYLPLQLRL